MPARPCQAHCSKKLKTHIPMPDGNGHGRRQLTFFCSQLTSKSIVVKLFGIYWSLNFILKKWTHRKRFAILVQVRSVTNNTKRAEEKIIENSTSFTTKKNITKFLGSFIEKRLSVTWRKSIIKNFHIERFKIYYIQRLY